MARCGWGRYNDGVAASSASINIISSQNIFALQTSYSQTRIVCITCDGAPVSSSGLPGDVRWQIPAAADEEREQLI